MSDDFEPDATSTLLCRLAAGWTHLDNLAVSLALWVLIIELVRVLT